MRELVEAIDSHAEPIDLKATNNPNVEDQLGGNVQPPLDAQQILEDATQFQFADLSSKFLNSVSTFYSYFSLT